MQKIKQILSGAVGLLMSGATLMTPALADFTLDNFNTMTAANTVVVVGTDAKAMDIVGAINVGAAIAQNGATAEGGSAAVVSGAESDDVPLNTAVNATLTKSSYKDNDIAGFIDTTIDWNDEDLDVFEELVITSDLVVLTSSFSVTQEELGDNVVLGTLDEDAIGYNYVIDDNDLDVTLVGEGNDEDTIEVTILGRSIEITNVDNQSVLADQITIKEGFETALKTGESIEIEGKTLTVTGIGQDSVAFDVGGQTDIVEKANGAEEIKDTGIKVDVTAILYNDDVESRQVFITVGTDITKTVKTGEPMVIFGEVDDEDDAQWVWYVDTSADTQLTVGARYNQKYDEEDEPVIAVGESLSLPNDYAAIELTELTETTYGTYEMTFVDTDVDENSTGGALSGAEWENLDVLQINALGGNDDGFLMVGGDETDTIYLSKAKGLLYKNDDSDIVQSSVNTTTLQFDDSTYTVLFNASALAGELVIDELGQNIKIDLDADLGAGYKTLGSAVVGEATSAELMIGATSIGTRDFDVMTSVGVVFEDPENNGDSDKIVMRVPTDDVLATVTIKGTGSSVETIEGGVTQVDLGNGIAKLASEAEADKTAKNLVLMGGPYANSLVEELAVAGKTPTRAQWGDLTGKAIIQAIDGAFVEGKAAIVVAGFDAEQTRSAALKLMAGGLTGAMVEVVDGTTTATTYTPEAAEVVDDVEEVIEPIVE